MIDGPFVLLIEVGLFVVSGLCVWLTDVVFNSPKTITPKPPDEKTLERWHDLYDRAILEGCDEAMAVQLADDGIVAAPKPVKYRSQSWEDFYPDLKRSPVYHHGDYLPWHDPGIRSN